MGPQGVLGIWGEWLFIFRKLWSTCNYFRGAREQAHNFGDLGSLAKKQKKKKQGKASILLDCFTAPRMKLGPTRSVQQSTILFDFLKISSASGRLAPQTPLVNSECIYFCTNMLIKIDRREKYGN